jgi:protein TonB
MIESTARAERFDLQTSKSNSYLWEVPQKPVAVRIPFNVMDRLEREAVEAFRSLSSRGSEIGGLLVGDVTSANPLVVSIADYELISCDYARGPLYRLAEADMERFQRAMEKLKGGPGQTVAGFFRSHTRKGIMLDADDLAFYQACFREAHHIGLLVRPFATKASTAGIFIWENGKIHGDSSYLEFPFRSSELGGKGVEAPAPEAKAAPPAQPAPPPVAPKAPARAQIVPIASRRDVSTPSEPAPAPVASAPVAPPPVVREPEPPKVEEKPVQPERNKGFDKSVKKTEPAKPAAPPAPAAKAAPPAPPAKPAEKAPEKVAAAPVAKTVDKPAAKPAEKPVEKPAEKPADRSFEKSFEKPAEAKSGGKGLKLVLAAAATIALFVGLFVYPGFLRTSTKAPVTAGGDSSPLQLRVERANGDLLLTWNRDTDAIRNATKATLQINDGDQHENVDMDLSQLRNNGSIVYSPSTSDVSFTMEVVGRDQTKTKSEVVRALLRTKQSPLETQVAEVKPAPNVTTVPTNQPNQPTPSNPKNDAKQTPTTTAEEPAQPQEAPKPQRRGFDTSSLTPISQRIRPAVSTDIPDAPTAGAATAALPGVNLPVGNVVPGAPVAPPVRPNAPTPTPATPTPSSPVNSANPKQGGNIQQAVLVSRKEPEYPKIAKQTGAKGAVVLNATIGKDGHIKAVKVISGHPMLQNAAKEAVMQWVYKPTLLNGQAVETETQITLNFVGER